MHASTRSRQPRPRLFLELETDPAPTLGGSEVAPQRLDESVDWESLAPRGLWAELGRPVLDEVLLAVFLVPCFLLALPVAFANALALRSLRKVFFVQSRVGYRGRVFQLVKFRTMRDVEISTFEAWSSGDRARVTRFGRFLRNTHLDELPQLINVMRGEMSFIGPRPEMVEVEEWANANVPGFIERLAIRPGITGLAQVTQGYTPRDVAAYERKFELNREYLRRFSFRLDLELLVRTALWMIRGRGWRWKRNLPA